MGEIKGNHIDGKGFVTFENGFVLEGRFFDDELVVDQDSILIDLQKGTEEKVVEFVQGNRLVKTEARSFRINYPKGVLESLN